MSCSQAQLVAAKRYRDKYPERARASQKAHRNSKGYNEKRTARRLAKPTIYALKDQQWARLNRERKILSAIRRRSRNLGVPFDLTLDDIKVPETCPVLGIPISIHTGCGHSQNSPSVDRMIPALGYVRGNVWVISQLANAMKQNATSEQLLTFSKYWLAKLGGSEKS